MVHLINSSLKSGCVPVDFKHAVVQPLLKKPNLDPTTLANFRPISKLPFLSKVLEKAVYEQLQSYIDQNTIAEKFQSGFKPCHSTETALLRVFNDLFLTADSGGHSVLVLLDLTAAFDTVDHGILLSRLELSVGLKGTVLKWFDSYLKDRSFSVNVGSCFSSVSPIHCGVPQGSILGPLLFSLYLLPLGLILEKHKVGYHFYADDLQIYMPLKSSSKGSLNPLLDCIQEVKLWMEANFLSLNKDKTEILIFGNSDSNVLNNCDSAIGPLASFCHPFARNLGVFVDNEFKFEKHINHVVKSSFFHLKTLSKVKNYLPACDFEKAIHAFITSRLDYCNSVYIGLGQRSIRRLQGVQNAAAHLLTGTKKRQHITPVLAALHWLPVYYRIRFKLLLVVFKCLHGTAPLYLSELLVRHAPARALRSADQLLLEVPRSKRVTKGDRAFSVAAPKLWNDLPLHIRAAQTLDHFKSLLKTHFYAKAFNTV
uniref:Reverse transcriptase domain-containing protein n=1 Tax=Neogobius melanostomus TaxID=47308 RepID=A0A8C6UH90_9GOBI